MPTTSDVLVTTLVQQYASIVNDALLIWDKIVRDITEHLFLVGICSECSTGTAHLHMAAKLYNGLVDR